MKELCDMGNFVIVVEYDKDMMFVVDYVIDMGFKVGWLGGEVVFVGIFEEMLKISILIL